MNNYKIFASIIDDATQKQVEKTANSDAYKGCEIRIMPDCHAGIGCTVGSVIRFKDRVVPNTVGVDIGCGMLVTEIGKVDVDLALLDSIVTKKIPSGFNVHDQPFNIRDWSMSFNAKIDNMDYILRSIGTLGGGNHFIELDEDEDGNKYLVIHSGSRNLGVQVCNYWQKKGIENLTSTNAACKELIARLKAEGRQREIGEALKQIKKPQIDEELAYIEGSDLEAYLADMKQCQQYAVHNRMVMTGIICTAMGWTWKAGAQFSTIHNYIDIENKIIRKGAISAQKGEKVIIPMNMRDGSLICVGKGNEDWLCSAPHGAGRIMSRAQAFKQVHMDEFQKSMGGIYSTSVCEGRLDEAPQVYKSAYVIQKDIEPTVEILKVIKPIWNFKAKTSENTRPPKASK